MNDGLERRFQHKFTISNYTPEELYKIFLKKIGEIGWSLENDKTIDIQFFKNNKQYFKFFV